MAIRNVPPAVCCGIVLMLGLLKTASTAETTLNASLKNASCIGSTVIFDHEIRIASLSSVFLSINDLPENCSFSIVQVHSFPTPILLQSGARSVNESDVAFLVTKTPTVIRLTNQSPTDVDTLIVAQTYSNTDPVPGGCSLETPIETSPSLTIETGEEVYYVKASKAASLIIDENCLGTDDQIYEFYYVFKKSAISEAARHFDTVRSLITYPQMQSSHEAFYMAGPPNQRLFALYPSLCSYHGAVVRTPYGVAAYAPTSRLLCNNETAESLSFKDSVYCIGAFVLLLRLGLCLEAYVTFLAAIVTATTSFYAQGGIYHKLVCLSAAAVGTFAIMLSTMLQRFVPAVVTSAVLSSTLLFYSVGNNPIFCNDLAYWFLMLVYIWFISIPLWNIDGLSTRILGGYLMTVFLFSLHPDYAILNPIRRLIYENFDIAITTPPFDLLDGAFYVSWMVISLLGRSKPSGRCSDEPTENDRLLPQ